MVSVGSGINAFSKDVRTTSIGAAGVACNSASASSPTPGCNLFSAVITYIQKRVGSLSPSSSETQARDQVLWLISAYQLLSNVVLPQPAGATTRVSLLFMAAFIRSVSRGRATRFRRAGGT